MGFFFSMCANMIVGQKYINFKNVYLLFMSHDLFTQVKLVQKTHRKKTEACKIMFAELVALVVLFRYNMLLC